MPHALALCLNVTKCLRGFILHAGVWGIYKRFFFGCTGVSTLQYHELFGVFLKFQLSWTICLISLIFLPNWKKCQMVTLLKSINHGLGYLTSVIWPFILTAFHFGSCLYYANISHFKDRRAVNFSQRYNRIPKLNASIVHNTSTRQQWRQWEWMVTFLFFEVWQEYWVKNSHWLNMDTLGVTP